jgi:MFS family permease
MTALRKSPDAAPAPYRVFILLLICGLYFFSYFFRVAIPGTIFNELQSDFAVSASSIALLGAVTFYVYASLQMFVGGLADRFGGPRMLVLGATCMAGGAILFPLSESLTMLLVARALTGFGASFIFLCMVKEIDELFAARHFTMVLSAAIFIGYWGGPVGTYPLEEAVAALGWRRSLGAVAALCTLLTLVITFKFYTAGMLRARSRPFSLGRIRDVITNRAAIPALCSGSLCFAIYLLFQATVGKKMLEDCFGLTSARAAAITFAMAIANITGTVLSGFVCRLISNRRKPLILIASFCLVLSLAGMLAVMAGVLGVSWIMLCYIVLALAGCCGPIFSSVMKETNPPDSVATSIGYINFTCYSLIALLGSASGIILDAFKTSAHTFNNVLMYPPRAYALLLTLCLVLALAALVMAFFVRETRGSGIYKEQEPLEAVLQSF